MTEFAESLESQSSRFSTAVTRTFPSARSTNSAAFQALFWVDLHVSGKSVPGEFDTKTAQDDVLKGIKDSLRSSSNPHSPVYDALRKSLDKSKTCSDPSKAREHLQALLGLDCLYIW